MLVASQKTLPVAVTVLNQLAAAMPGAVGLAVIPCVVRCCSWPPAHPVESLCQAARPVQHCRNCRQDSDTSNSTKG